MPKLKKLKRKKKFRVNVNRKRLRNKLRKLPNIECKEIKEAWEIRRSTVTNLKEMGLAYDPNKVLKIPNVKEEMLNLAKNQDSENDESDSEKVVERIPQKLHVAQKLEEEAKCPRAKLFRLPNNEVHFITYMIDKYGDDYKAMVRDRKNYNQMTWRQIKAKIEKFKSIPEQYAEYLVNKGEIILEDPIPLKKIKPVIMQEPVEKKTNSKLSRRKRKKAKLLDSIWQEETINVDDTINNDSTKESTNNIELHEDSNGQVSSEKKLQLFSDDDSEDDDDVDDDDDMDDDISDSENESDINKKKVEPKKNTKSLKLEKSKILKQKIKKIKVR